MASAYNISVEELDHTSEQSAHPANIKITLWPHQLTLLERCKTLENKQLQLDSFESLKATHPNLTESDYMRTQIGIIGDSVGSGKSYVVLALMRENDITNLGSTVKSYGHNKVVFCYSERTINLKTNLLVIPHNLVAQWETYITTFADDMKYIIVSKAAHVERLREQEASIHEYNIIVVTATQYTDVARFLSSRTFKMQRVVYDEIDNVNLPSCVTVDSNFYWFVSASFGNLLYPKGYVKRDDRTSRAVYYANGLRNSGFVKETFMDLYNHLPKEMVKLLILKNKDSYVQESISLPPVRTNQIICKTPISISILDGFVDREIIQSLNAGDLASALQRINPANRTKEDNIVAIQIQKFVKEIANCDVLLAAANAMARPCSAIGSA